MPLEHPWIAFTFVTSLASIAAACGDPPSVADDGDPSSTTGGTSSSTGEASRTTTDDADTSADGATSSSSGSGSETGVEGCHLWSTEQGVDADDCGPEASPCRTLTFVIGLAEAGCTIHLGPGSYGPDSGEQVPWEIPAGVDLIGAGSDLAAAPSVLDDSSNSSTSTFDVACDGEVEPKRSALVVHGGRVQDVVVRGGTGSDYVTVLVLEGTVELDSLRVEGGQEGIFVAGTSMATMTSLYVTGAGHAAIKPAGDSVVDITAATLVESKDALEPICHATTTIRESAAYCNGNGLEALDGAQTTMIDNDVHHNINGIGARGANASITLVANTIHDNSFGIVEIFGQLAAGTTAAPGGNAVYGNRYAGVMLNGVAQDTFAVGNTWEPLVDGADAAGAYGGDVTIMGPVCGNNNSEIEAPIPVGCDPAVPVVPDPSYQNYVLNDGSCMMPATCGGMLAPCPVLGALVLSE